ncbi:MAG: NUDIX hydrolase [Bacteroidota bacterium]
MEIDSNTSFLNRIPSFMPGISMDFVVFGYKERTLHILMLKYLNTDAWALPGGFLPKDAEMDKVAHAILEDRTGVSNIFLDQFYTFNSLNRGWDCNDVSRNAFEKLRETWNKEEKETLDEWFGQRFISTAYLSLMNAQEVVPDPDYISDDCAWVPIEELPSVVLDHELMIQKALEYIRLRINYLPIGRSLLEEKFTMSDLQALYEAILGRKMDAGNFQRKMKKLNMLNRHEKLMTGAANKAPYLYSINDEVYDRLLEQGIGFT